MDTFFAFVPANLRVKANVIVEGWLDKLSLWPQSPKPSALDDLTSLMAKNCDPEALASTKATTPEGCWGHYTEPEIMTWAALRSPE